MTLTDELKIFDDKIKANQVQYDLERKAARISALSSKELDKCKYLTGEDLGFKLEVLEQAKLECSLLGKVFNKGSEKEDKKEGLLKTLKNIEDKNQAQLERQLKPIENDIDNANKKAFKKIKVFKESWS